MSLLLKMSQIKLVKLMTYSKMMNFVYVQDPEKYTFGQKKDQWYVKCPLKGERLGLVELNGEEKEGW